MTRSVASGIRSLLCAVIFSLASAAMGQQPETRALWADRWSVDSESKVQSCMDYAAAHKFNVVLIQVFGGGYALYNSTFVPRWPANPTFDVLASAIAKGQASGIEVHAYINCNLVHQGSSPTPTSPGHLINAHPDWACVSPTGVSMIANVGVPGTDIFFDPHQPGFRDYLVSVLVIWRSLRANGPLHTSLAGRARSQGTYNIEG